VCAIISSVRDTLLEVARDNPHGNGYVFFGISEKNRLIDIYRLGSLTGKLFNELSKTEREEAKAYW
jgi:hypothetical protein